MDIYNLTFNCFLKELNELWLYHSVYENARKRTTKNNILAPNPIAPYPHYLNYNQHQSTLLTFKKFNRDLNDIEDIPFLYNVDPPTTNKQRTTLFVTASCQKYTAVNATICLLIPDWLSLIDTSKFAPFRLMDWHARQSMRPDQSPRSLPMLASLSRRTPTKRALSLITR